MSLGVCSGGREMGDAERGLGVGVRGWSVGEAWSLCRYWGFDAGGDYLADAVLDVINGSVFAYWYDAMGFAGRDLFVLFVDAAVEVVGFALEAVLVGALLCDVPLVAAAGAAKGGFEGGEEKDGEVGLEVIAGGAVHGEDALAA